MVRPSQTSVSGTGPGRVSSTAATTSAPANGSAGTSALARAGRRGSAVSAGSAPAPTRAASATSSQPTAPAAASSAFPLTASAACAAARARKPALSSGEPGARGARHARAQRQRRAGGRRPHERRRDHEPGGLGGEQPLVRERVDAGDVGHEAERAGNDQPVGERARPAGEGVRGVPGQDQGHHRQREGGRRADQVQAGLGHGDDAPGEGGDGKQALPGRGLPLGRHHPGAGGDERARHRSKRERCVHAPSTIERQAPWLES